MSAWRIPRESVELVGPVTVTDDGAVVAVFEVAVIPRGARPASADWAAPDDVAGVKYVLIGPGSARPLAPGHYDVWVRHAAAPETPVMDDAGSITVT